MHTAVLFLFFNRPDTTRAVFERIRAARPPRLYLAGDGPRATRPGEDKIVQDLRDWIVSHIDWPCQVFRHFNPTNQGCGHSVSGAITWFFRHEPQGIILEDDCVPHPDFFGYCEQLLKKYRTDHRVWHISGMNPILPEEGHPDTDSYYFTPFMHCWGWASWADRWSQYTYDLSDYDPAHLDRISPTPDACRYWRDILARVSQMDTWDYQWLFQIVAQQGLCICPTRNLISNIGDDGAHIRGNSDALFRRTYPCLPLKHPAAVAVDLARLSCQERLFSALQHPSRRTCILLFGILPFLKVKTKRRTTWIYLFGLPLLRLKSDK